MIQKIVLNINENISPALIKWGEEEDDFIIDVPNGITRLELIRLTDEIKRITEWEM